MFLPTTQTQGCFDGFRVGRNLSFRWFSLFILAMAAGSGYAPFSFGQGAQNGSSVRTAMDYSDEQPEWLHWIAGSGKSSRNSGWWPNWKMPSWKMPGWGKSKSQGWWSTTTPNSSYKKNNKTLTQKISQTSKRWWSNTVEFLDPWAEPKPKPGRSDSDSGGFGKMFGWQESEQKFNSVPEWMGQPTPK